MIFILWELIESLKVGVTCHNGANLLESIGVRKSPLNAVRMTNVKISSYKVNDFAFLSARNFCFLVEHRQETVLKWFKANVKSKK